MGKLLLFCHIKVDFPSSVAILIAKPGRSLIKRLGLCVFPSEKTIKIAFVSHYSHIIIFASLYYLFSSSEWRPLTQFCGQKLQGHWEFQDFWGDLPTQIVHTLWLCHCQDTSSPWGRDLFPKAEFTLEKHQKWQRGMRKSHLPPVLAWDTLWEMC